MIVLDASAAVDFLVDRRAYDALAQRALRAGTLHAPHLLDVEVMNGLRRLVLQGTLDEPRATTAISDYVALRIERYPHARFIERIWELRDVLPASDAAYVALAETLEAPLVTTDARLARSHGHAAVIELVGG